VPVTLGVHGTTSPAPQNVHIFPKICTITNVSIIPKLLQKLHQYNKNDNKNYINIHIAYSFFYIAFLHYCLRTATPSLSYIVIYRLISHSYTHVFARARCITPSRSTAAAVSSRAILERWVGAAATSPLD
jgi:hypothetical protein